METVETRKHGDYCHRCLEPTPPEGGERIHRAGNIRKMLAAFGLLMFLAIAAPSIWLMQTSGAPLADQAGKPDEVKSALGQ